MFRPQQTGRTWTQLRSTFVELPARDALDYLDVDIALGEWLSRIQRTVVDGTYRPEHPGRRTLAKSGGAYRVITAPSIEDMLVYMHIALYIRDQALEFEPPGAFFQLKRGVHPIGEKVDEVSSQQYVDFWEVWIRYDQYRALLGLNGLYKAIVVTDISNYFDSIEHSLLLEYLTPYRVPRQALGTLGQLLDVLRPLAGHSPAPRVGLPIDSFGASRILAHLFLFEHDRRMMKKVGDLAYVRWMDDQNLGTSSKTAARAVVKEMVGSLAKQHLTLNSGKTRILTPSEQAKHLCLSYNKRAERLEKALAKKKDAGPLRSSFERLWDEVLGDRTGMWHKVAKRLLRLAAMLKTDHISLAHCKDLLVETPELAERIFDYLAFRGRFPESIELFEWYLDSGESLYEDVEARWFEVMLTFSQPVADRPALRRIALEFVRGAKRGTRTHWPRVPAALLLYWLGGAREVRVLAKVLETQPDLDGPTRRAITAILCATAPDRRDEWTRTASKRASTHVSRLVEAVARLASGDPCDLPRSKLVFRRRPLNQPTYVYDARVWLRLELMLLSPRLDIRTAVQGIVNEAVKQGLTPSEQSAARRLQRRLGGARPPGGARPTRVSRARKRPKAAS